MRRWLLPLLFVAAPAFADAPNTGVDREVFRIGMSVPPLCILGEPASGSGAFDMGVMSDRQSGLLRDDLQAPDKRLVASFCNGPSILTIAALPMLVVGNAAARDGFARRIDYVATARGWTDEAATFETDGASTQPDAIRRRAGPLEADILIGVSAFAVAGGNALRPVAGRYAGTIVVTLGPTS